MSVGNSEGERRCDADGVWGDRIAEIAAEIRQTTLPSLYAERVVPRADEAAR